MNESCGANYQNLKRRRCQHIYYGALYLQSACAGAFADSAAGDPMLHNPGLLALLCLNGPVASDVSKQTSRSHQWMPPANQF